MFRKIWTVVFCFVLLFGIASIASAKKEKASGDDGTTTAVEKLSEPKDNLKEKIGLAFTTAGTGSARMWITNTLGLDMSANLGVGGGEDFRLDLGANIVFPILEEGPAALYLKPGMLIGFDTSAFVSHIKFDFTVGLEAEAFIVKNLLAVGGSMGMNIGINVNSPAGGITTTDFVLDIGSSTGALFVRVYM